MHNIEHTEQICRLIRIAGKVVRPTGVVWTKLEKLLVFYFAIASQSSNFFFATSTMLWAHL